MIPSTLLPDAVTDTPIGHRVWYSPSGNPMTDITEIEYKGRRIVQNRYTPLFNNSDTLGFDVSVAYVVLDEFDEPALPTIQQWFWNPHEAKAAIDLCDWLTERVDKNKPSWPSTVAHEFNLMLCYRRQFFTVYTALDQVREMCREARDFDENPREDILSRLDLLRSSV